MIKWLYEHSLSLSLIALYFFFQIVASLVSEEPFTRSWFQTMFQGHANATMGAILIVLFTKWFRERGSNQSK